MFLCRANILVLLSSGGLLSLVASELGLGLGLDGLVGSANGGSTLDSGSTEIGAVVVLGGLVGNGKVCPIWGKNRQVSI